VEKQNAGDFMESLERKVAEWGQRITEVRVKIHFDLERARGELSEVKEKLPALLADQAMGEGDARSVREAKRRIADLEERISDCESIPPELDRKHRRWMGASSLIQGIKRDMEKAAELQEKQIETADPRRQGDIDNLKSWVEARKARIAELIPGIAADAQN
jgi:hypothetical protein